MAAAGRLAFPRGMTLESIDDVLRELDAIVAVSRERGVADGYFAALYRRTTAEELRVFAQALRAGSS